MRARPLSRIPSTCALTGVRRASKLRCSAAECTPENYFCRANLTDELVRLSVGAGSGPPVGSPAVTAERGAGMPWHDPADVGIGVIETADGRTLVAIAGIVKCCEGRGRESIVCTRCGLQTETPAQFCPKCGAFLEWEGQKLPGSEPADLAPSASGDTAVSTLPTTGATTAVPATVGSHIGEENGGVALPAAPLANLGRAGLAPVDLPASLGPQRVAPRLRCPLPAQLRVPYRRADPQPRSRRPSPKPSSRAGGGSSGRVPGRPTGTPIASRNRAT